MSHTVMGDETESAILNCNYSNSWYPQGWRNSTVFHQQEKSWIQSLTLLLWAPCPGRQHWRLTEIYVSLHADHTHSTVLKLHLQVLTCLGWWGTAECHVPVAAGKEWSVLPGLYSGVVETVNKDGDYTDKELCLQQCYTEISWNFHI